MKCALLMLLCACATAPEPARPTARASEAPQQGALAKLYDASGTPLDRVAPDASAAPESAQVLHTPPARPRRVGHVLGALGLLALTPLVFAARRFVRLAGAVVAAALLGFAFQSGAEHRALAERDGGRPLFEPAISGERDALLFVDSDHGFNLAYRPGERSIARYRGDGVDWLAWLSAGRPAAFRYRFERDGSWLEPLAFREDGPLVIEGESLWPPAEQRKGWAWPSHSPRGCVSAGRLLAFYPVDGEVEVALRLPRAAAGRTVRAHAVLGIDAPGREKNSMILEYYVDRAVSPVRVDGPSGCVEAPPVTLANTLNEPLLVIRANDPVAIDMLDLGEKR